MSWQAYNDFIGVARELYDLDLDNAREFYREFRADFEVVPDVDDLLSYPETAAALVEDMDLEPLVEIPVWVDESMEEEYFDYVDTYGEEPPEEYFDYELDDAAYGWDDEWLDPGDEIEISEDLAYKED